MVDKRIPFAQFGGNFLDLVLTSDTLTQQISAAVRGVPTALLSAETQIDSHLVRYSAVLGQVTVARTPAPDAFHFTVDLPVTVALEIREKGAEWINSGYAVAANVRFALTALTLDPLVIFLDFAPVTPESVTASVDMTKGGILEKLANAEEQIEKVVKEQLATAVHKALTDSAGSRRVDVYALVRSALTGQTDATEGGARGDNRVGKPGGATPDVAVSADPGELLADMLLEDGWRFYRVPVPAGGALACTVYAQRLEGPGMFSVAITDDMGGVIASKETWIEAFGFDFARVPFEAKELAMSEVILRLHANAPMRFKMKL